MPLSSSSLSVASTTPQFSGPAYQEAARSAREEIIERLGLPDRAAHIVRGNSTLYETTLDVPDLGLVRAFCAHSRPNRRSRRSQPAKGGYRVMPDVDGSLIAGLADDMLIKCALWGLPYDGAKCGVKIPTGAVLTQSIRRKLAEELALALIEANMIGPETYIPAPDMNSGPFDMEIFRQVLAYYYPKNPDSLVTGTADGIAGRSESTGYIAARATLETIRRMGLADSYRPSVSIAGCGKGGIPAMRRFDQFGIAVTGVSDVRGGTYNPHGLAVDELIEHVRGGGDVVDFAGGDSLSYLEMLGTGTTAHLEAGPHGLFSIEAATAASAQVVVELGNRSITPGAASVLRGKEIPFVPGVLSGGGGVDVSHQSVQLGLGRHPLGSNPSAADVLARSEETVVSRLDAVFALAERQQMEVDEAAMAVATYAILEREAA